MREYFWEIAGLVVVTAMIVLFLGRLFYWNPHSLNTTCSNRFGKEWSGRIGIYSQDVCVNTKGEVKYP